MQLPKAGAGNISLDVLATADGAQYVRYGYNLQEKQFFIDSGGMLTTSSKPQTAYAANPEWISMTVLVDGAIVELFTDSSASMARSPVHLPLPNGAATTRSFLPAEAPFGLDVGRGAFLSAVPVGVACGVQAAELEL